VRPGVADDVPLALWAVVELSLQALPNDYLRAGFAELGAFAPKPADFSRLAALAVWDVGEDEGDQRLQTLTQRGLLEITGEDRFALHQVLAAVADAQLGEETGAAERHFAYYLQFVERDLEAWPVIEQELAQIRHAWEWASGTPGREVQALLLVRAMRVYMQVRGLSAEQLAWYERAIQAAQVLGNLHEEATLINNIGDVHKRRREWGDALGAFEAALHIRRMLGDREGEAGTLNNVGTVYRELRQPEGALPVFEQALSIYRVVGDPWGEAIALHNTGLVHHDRRNWEAALACYEQALTIRRMVGDRVGQASTLTNIAACHLDRGVPAKALSVCEQALVMWRMLGDREREAGVLLTIVLAHNAGGAVEQAISTLEQVVALEERIEHPDLDQHRAFLKRLRAKPSSVRT
jgi:tetratricopeptide (TPR) repeat protein